MLAVFHGLAAVQENLKHTFLFFHEKFYEQFVKTRICVPVYSSDVVSEHVFPEVRKLNGITLGITLSATGLTAGNIKSDTHAKRMQFFIKFAVKYLFHLLFLGNT